MADAWEEIRRLAADFQRAQFAEATQRCWTLPVHCGAQVRPWVDTRGIDTLGPETQTSFRNPCPLLWPLNFVILRVLSPRPRPGCSLAG
jgi:hypothetical protein